jgi:tetratricopeptide (TPR) repeat protein
MQQEAREKVLRDRINRRQEFYSMDKLGAFGSDLGAIACFFEQPWIRVSNAVKEADQGWLFNQAAFSLRAVGRLTEALEPARVGMERAAKREDWKNAASGATNLSELELALGEVAGAVEDAKQSVTYADRSGDAFERSAERTAHADALHQVGRRVEAERRFREAEQMQKEWQPGYPLLYSQQGFIYCDLLLAAPERAAWQRRSVGVSPAGSPGVPPGGSGGGTPLGLAGGTAALLSSCRAVSQRAAQTLKWAEMGSQGSLLDIAINHLTLGRAALYAAILEGRDGALRRPRSPQRGDPTSDDYATARRELDAAVDGLRRAGIQDYIPRGLLTRA